MSNKKILQGHNQALESLATIVAIPLEKIDLSSLGITKVFQGTVKFTELPVDNDTPLSSVMATGITAANIVAIIINPRTVISDYNSSNTYLQSCVLRKAIKTSNVFYGKWEGYNINGIQYNDTQVAVDSPSTYAYVISNITSDGDITFFSKTYYSLYKANVTYDVWVLGK